MTWRMSLRSESVSDGRRRAERAAEAHLRDDEDETELGLLSEIGI
jgi:hypothetical protein